VASGWRALGPRRWPAVLAAAALAASGGGGGRAGGRHAHNEYLSSNRTLERPSRAGRPRAAELGAGRPDAAD